jgi:uncharacterized protein (DUF58 family)
MDALLMLLVLAALFVVQGFLLKHFAFSRLEYRRSFSRGAGFEGEEAFLVEVIRNRKLLPIPWLRAESRLSPHLGFGADAELTITGERYHKSVFFLGPWSQITRTHTVKLKKRGFYKAGSVAVTAGDLFGVGAAQRQFENSADIEVYPRLLPPEEFLPPSSRWQGDLLVKRWIVDDPFLVGGIRPYRFGDSPRDIHWAASARAGELQVKVREHTASPQLLVVLNAQMSEHQWADLMEYEQQVIEYGISLAASLCVDMLRQGLAAGFAANIPLDKGGEPTIMPPARYAAREEELLSAMAHLTILRTHTFSSLLDKLMAFTGLDIIVLSPYDSETIQLKLNALQIRGNSVSLRLLDKQAAAFAFSQGKEAAHGGE